MRKSFLSLSATRRSFLLALGLTAVLICSSHDARAQNWMFYLPNQPINCPPGDFNRALFNGLVGVGGLVPGVSPPCQNTMDAQELLHLHSILGTDALKTKAANLLFQSHDLSIPSSPLTVNRFAPSEIKFRSGSKKLLSGQQWDVATIKTIAIGRGNYNQDPWQALYETQSPTSDFRGGLAFFNSNKNNFGQTEVMRLVGNRVGVGLNTPQGNATTTVNDPYVSPAGRLHVVSQTILGTGGGDNTVRPDYQGLLTLLPGNNGNWWHIRNDNSTLRIMTGAADPNIPTDENNYDSDCKPPHTSKRTAMTFQNWSNSVTIGSDIIPMNATCAVYTEPLIINNPNLLEIQPITLRVARKNTNLPGVPSGIVGNKDYKLISAGHESEESFVVKGDGKVGIGTATPQQQLHVVGDVQIGDQFYSKTALPLPSGLNYRMSVDGQIVTKNIFVTLTGGWSDFVFNSDYNLPPLADVEKFITENKHLPDVPSEKEVTQNGIDVAKMQSKLLQKIEELTLYVIQLEKKNNQLNKRVEELEIDKK